MITKNRRQTLGQLRALQHLSGAAIMRPLSRTWRMQRKWTDNRDMRIVAGEFIKPNDRLTSFERIEIYNRQYWYRIIDSFYADFPGLLGVLGRLKFNRLAKAYLAQYPSRSFTMRNLGISLCKFIQDNPQLVAPRFDMAFEAASLEWAQILAFDGSAKPPVTVDDLLGNDPSKLRLAIQPYITILHLKYPLDDYVIRVKKNLSRGDASNAVEESKKQSRRAQRRVPIPRAKETFIVVHRLDNSIYYKPIDRRAHRLLTSLARGITLGKAIESAFADKPDLDLIRRWFTTWTELGWFCKPHKPG